MLRDGSGVVIIGAGPAGGEVAAALRMRGYVLPITIVGAEAHLPYGRPPLSKSYFRGDVQADELYLRPMEFYRTHGITVLTGQRAEKIDRDSGYVFLNNGERLPYDDLVVATGGQPRVLPESALATAPNVLTIRTISDVDSLRAQITCGSRLVIIGGGFVGLEIAAVARELGSEVTILEAASRLLSRATSTETSAFLKKVHLDHGVNILTDVVIQGFDFDQLGLVSGVKIETSQEGAPSIVAADVLLVGIGMSPNDAIAAEAGLATDNGIVVDSYCRTEDAHVFAIGDVSRHPCHEHGGLRRLESMGNASEQARTVAGVIVGEPVAYTNTPWFWSDQYDIKLQIIGMSASCDEVVVRDSSSETQMFCALYLKDGEVRAADVVSRPRDFAAAKKLVSRRARVPAEVLRDTSVALASIANMEW